MLDDAVRARSRVENATVLDVAELLERSMEVPGGR